MEWCRQAVFSRHYPFSEISLVTVRNEVAKVMFLQACVCPQGGEYLTRYTPPVDQVHPPVDQVHTPPWDQVHPLGPGTPPGTRYTPLGPCTLPGPGTPPRTRYTPKDQVHSSRTSRYTPPRDTATAADGTHPTGMHFCTILNHSNIKYKLFHNRKVNFFFDVMQILFAHTESYIRLNGQFTDNLQLQHVFLSLPAKPSSSRECHLNRKSLNFN